MKLNGVVENSKCTLSFVSNMSDEERDNILKEGVTYRRNTYRGQDITKYKTGTTINGRDLYQQISDCTFDDIYVGDYILSDKTNGRDNKQIKWLIADLNNYLYMGDKKLTQCHATIIPASMLEYSYMNSACVTTGGYANSEMVTKILGTSLTSGEDTILSKYVYPDFGNHVIKYRNLLSTEVEIRDGVVSSGFDWYDRYLDLMSEVNVYGSIVWSSSGFDIGIDNHQYAIFKLRPDFINNDGNGNRYWYWLKAVTDSATFAAVHDNGSSTTTYANWSGGVRPRFLID